MEETLLSLVIVVAFRVNSLPQLPGLWVTGGVALVTRKVEQAAWPLQGEGNSVSTAELQSFLELVAVCPPGFSAVTHLAHAKCRSDVFGSLPSLLIVCFVVLS